jgi:protein-S-isoprenylcysteine O-methyltransferase Ste14
MGAVGLATMAAGIALRAGAVRALGGAYSHRIRPIASPVVARGPYRFVRHPAYLGTFVAHAGLVLVMPSALAALALFALWLPAVILRVAIEDRLLLGGAEYAAYAKKVPHRLVPKVY